MTHLVDIAEKFRGHAFCWQDVEQHCQGRKASTKHSLLCVPIELRISGQICLQLCLVKPDLLDCGVERLETLVRPNSRVLVIVLVTIAIIFVSTAMCVCDALANGWSEALPFA